MLSNFENKMKFSFQCNTKDATKRKFIRMRQAKLVVDPTPMKTPFPLPALHPDGVGTGWGL